MSKCWCNFRFGMNYPFNILSVWFLEENYSFNNYWLLSLKSFYICPPKAPLRLSTFQVCRQSSCRPSCIRFLSRLLPWQPQPPPGSSRALRAQVLRARSLRPLKPGWSSHDPPYPHASPSPLAQGGPPSTCGQQFPPQQDNRLAKYEHF